MKYIYCPQCGSKSNLEKSVPHCEACQLLFYTNSKPTAGAIIYNEKGEVLLTKRALKPVGKIDIIGGFLENGEDPIEGIKREVREEVGVEIDVEDIIGIYMDGYMDDSDSVYTLNIQYAAKIKSGTPVAKDEIQSVEWFREADLKPEEFSFKNTGLALNDFFRKYKENMTLALDKKADL